MRTIPHKLNVPLISHLVNLGSGLLLNLLKKFKPGDFIEINGEIGSVTSKKLASSQIKTVDGEIISIDNSTFFLGSMYNLSKENIIRLDLKLDICYTENIPLIKEAILSFLESQSGLISAPKIKISVSKLKENFVELEVSPWCALDNFLTLDHQLEMLLIQNLSIKGFKVRGIQSFSANREIA
jgi:small-conductance mechanosensitive channel